MKFPKVIRKTAGFTVKQSEKFQVNFRGSANSTGPLFLRAFFVALAVPLFFYSASAFAGSDNPFELGTSVATDYTAQLKTMAIAVAGLAGVVVILLGMFGVMRIRWAFNIGGGLIALTGLGWIISSLLGQ